MEMQAPPFRGVRRSQLSVSTTLPTTPKRLASDARRYRRLSLERLELRLAPATMLGVTADDVLVRFDSDSPGTIINSTPITGLVGGDSIDGIDFRPATGEIMALGSGDRLYTLNPVTGVATLRGNFPFDLQPGFTFGFDINPVTDELRITNDFDL